MITSPLLSPPFILLGLERNNLCLVALVLVVVGFVVVDSVLALANRRITSGTSGSLDKKHVRNLEILLFFKWYTFIESRQKQCPLLLTNPRL